MMKYTGCLGDEMMLSLEQAVERLRSGDVVAIPTETVYGLAASLRHPHAIERIFSLKGRPRTNPLILHVADLGTARAFTGSWSETVERLATALWPGPLTLLLSPAPSAEIPAVVTAGHPHIAIRIPAHPLCRALLQQTGPLVAPSANLSGRPSAASAAHVAEDFGEELGVLDGGSCEAGLESTILWTGPGTPRIVRLGALSQEWIQEMTGITCEQATTTVREGERPICPGQLLRHYAPRARLHPVSKGAPPPEAIVLGFPERDYPRAHLWSLGMISQPERAARALYHLLRRLDHEHITEAWYDDALPQEGLWRTIAERLARAAHAEAC